MKPMKTSALLLGMLKKPVQQGRSERKAEAYLTSYVEALSDARTPLEGFCNIPIKKRPALVWITGAAYRPESSSAILQSLKADYPAPQSSSGLASTAMPSGTDCRWRVP